jgi:phosphohistidine phosphatase
MISSPAKRALKTAEIIAKELDFPVKKIVADASIYAAGISDLLDVIRNIDDAVHHVMMYGHNPGITMLVEHLTHYRVENIPTCGIFCIDFDIDSWKEISEGGGTVVFFDYPKKHV